MRMIFTFLMCFLFWIKAVSAEVAPQEVQHWDCGTNCKATLYDSGLLKVTPTAETGEIGEYWAPEVSSTYGRLTDAPWSEYVSDITSVEIADGITRIGTGTFTGLKSMTSLQIADTVTSIGYLAFADNSNLQNVKISNSVETIESFAFSLCPVGEISLPDTLTTIGAYAFWGTSIPDTNIPDSVTSIGYGAFASIPGTTKLYCNNINGRCHDMISDTYSGAAHVVDYSIEGGRYVLNGQKYRSLSDMEKNINALKRIYSVEEANAAAGQKNTVIIRYK